MSNEPPVIYLRAAQSAIARVHNAKRAGEPTAAIEGEITENRAAYAVAKVLADAPPMTAESKARLLALIDSAPVL